MDLLQSYESDDSTSSSTSNQPSVPSAIPLDSKVRVCTSINSAPAPSLLYLSNQKLKTQSTNNVLALSNSSKDSDSSNAALYKAKKQSTMQGPSKPQSTFFSQPSGPNAGASGVYEVTAIDGATFDQNFNSYNKNGKTVLCDDYGTEVDVNDQSSAWWSKQRHLPLAGLSHPLAPKTNPADPSSSSSSSTSTTKTNSTSESRAAKRRRREMEDQERYTSDMTTSTTTNDMGFQVSESAASDIWAKPSKEEIELIESSATDLANGVLSPEQLAMRDAIAEKEAKRSGEAPDKEDMDFDRMVERKLAHLLPPRLESSSEAKTPTSKFHDVGNEVDYQGNAWSACPKGVRPSDGSHDSYIPKKCIHRFTGHSKGVHVVRFSPGTGHLLLSGGLDGKVKCWRILGGDKKCMRTYDGHSAAVRDVCWSNDGKTFLSASYDRYVRLWDVESGECLKTFTNRRVPYCVKFYPNDNNYFIGGYSDNKAVSYNINDGEISQEYNHHLAAINSVTFVEDGKKFVTTSDDKKMMVWEWDIGVPIKYIAEPDMHSMPSVAVHPNNSFMVMQSMDNEIKVYQAQGKFGIQRKKKFTGHQAAGYACEMAFSPNGRYLMSGDGSGKIFFWEFSTTKMYKKYHAHEKGPTIGCDWHPIEPSMVVSCGWDGVIKLWTS